MDARQSSALRWIHPTFVKKVNLEDRSNDIVAYLQDVIVLHSDDVDAIFSHSNRGNQANELLFIIKRRGPEKRPYEHSREILKRHYPEILKELDEHYDAIGEDIQEDTACQFCYLRNHIIATDLSHELYKYGIITEIQNKNIVDNRKDYTANVDKILGVLKNLPRESQIPVHHIFLEILKEKYLYIRRRICHLAIKDYTRCSCVSQAQIYISPRKVELGERSVLSKLGKFYLDIVLSREKFDGYENLITEKIKDERDPDVITLAYRSLICYKVYYLRNHQGTDEIYHLIKEQMPNTLEYSWHEALIESLLTLAKLQQKNYKEAALHLEKAKKITQWVKPGFLTGVVFFNEALYYWSMFMDNPRTASEYFLKRMQECFELSADSHENEDVFDMKFIIPQVFSYMALCFLQVDIVLSQDVGIPDPFCPICPEIREQARKVLKYVRDHKWENITKWTEMLYYRAKAQLCLQEMSDEGRKEALYFFKEVLRLASLCDFKVEKQSAENWIHCLTADRDMSCIPATVAEQF